MACLWRLYSHRRQAWHCHFAHPHLVRLHFISHTRLAVDHLFRPRILDEHQKIYSICEEKPDEISLEVSSFGFQVSSREK
jgi:hypothetical protein